MYHTSFITPPETIIVVGGEIDNSGFRSNMFEFDQSGHSHNKPTVVDVKEP